MTILTLQPDTTNGLDTYVNQASPNSSGGATDPTLSILGLATIQRRGLIKFDLSSIPAGATIDSAILTLYGQGSGADNLPLAVHRILVASGLWTEAAATWNFQDGVNRWTGDAASDGGTDAGCTQSGTDFSATTMASGNFDNAAGVGTDYVLDVTEFTLMVAANYGMLIRTTSGSAGNAQPGSSDNSTAARRPKLVVDYTAAALAPREVRIYAEGSLRWAEASGTGGWTTASGAPTALVGFVLPGATYRSARTVALVAERDAPHHHKLLSNDPVELQFAYRQAVTANRPNPATASGATVPKVHFEIKTLIQESPTFTAHYFQFEHCAKIAEGWMETPAGNVWTETWRALSMTGPTGSGYLS